MMHYIRLLIMIFGFLSFSENSYAQIKQQTFKIPNILEITIPPVVELQGGNYETIKNSILNSGYFDLSRQTKEYLNKSFIFQQIGLNELKKDAYNTYARVLISYNVGVDDGIGPFLTDADISRDELSYINIKMKDDLESELRKQNNKILSWYGVKKINYNNFSALKLSYSRQYLTNKPVYIEQYTIYNRGKEVKITISTRDEEKYSVYKDLWGIIDTIKLY